MDGDSRFWIDLAMKTKSNVEVISQDGREGLAFLTGAVFALHQDTLLAYGVDMRTTDDLLMAAAMDRMRPHALGDYPTRVAHVMEAMGAIDNMNLDHVEAARQSGEDKTQVHSYLAAHMRSLSSRIWLITMGSKTSAGKVIAISRETIWLMLGSISANETIENAKSFSGSYYNGINNQNYNRGNWPESPIVPCVSC